MSLLERLGLEQHADAYPFSLIWWSEAAGGIGSCYDDRSRNYGYDEPTSALDPELRLEVEKLILQNRELGDDSDRCYP